jgi:hypothetical protein
LHEPLSLIFVQALWKLTAYQNVSSFTGSMADFPKSASSIPQKTSCARSCRSGAFTTCSITKRAGLSVRIRTSIPNTFPSIFCSPFGFCLTVIFARPLHNGSGLSFASLWMPGGCCERSLLSATDTLVLFTSWLTFLLICRSPPILEV